MGNVQHAYVAQSLDGGVYFRAPLGTTMPVEPVEKSADLDPAFKDQGTCAVDGLSVGITRTSNEIKDFDGAPYIDVQTEYNGTFKIKLLDVDNEAVKKTAFGDANVTVTPADATNGARYHVAHNPDVLPLCSHVFATKYGNKYKTYAIDIGRVTEIAEFKAESQDAMGLELTVKAYRNAAGNFVEEYGDIDGETVPGPLTVKVVATGAWRFGLGGQLTAPLSETSTNAEVQSAIEALSTFSGTVTVTGATAGTYNIALSDGATVSVDGAATLS